MTALEEQDASLRLVDAVLRDLAMRSAMFVGRRSEGGNARTFVVQFGEDGRLRFPIPDLNSPASVEQVVADMQAQLEPILGSPAPLCPLHPHALVAEFRDGTLLWACPDDNWQCTLGDYEDRTWPQLEVESLPPFVSRRLARYGPFPSVVTIGVQVDGEERVAEFGVLGDPEEPELIRRLGEIVAPLRVVTHEHRGGRPRRVGRSG